MASIQRFEEIEAWKKARELVSAIYQITGEGGFSRTSGYETRYAVRQFPFSSNIAEGFERDGNQEFLQFLSLAKGSCGEVRAQLYVALRPAVSDDATI